MADPKQYHYRLQDPYEYDDAEGLTNLSLLAVDIKDLYPTGWLLKHDNELQAKIEFMKLPPSERYPHLWVNTYVGEKKRANSK
jgi:hypothetical protein